MREHLTGERIANSILMDKKLKEFVLIVEGSNDELFFAKFTNKDKCSIIQAKGNKHLEDAIKILNQNKFENKIGIIDSDFNKLNNKSNRTKDLIVIDYHDLEVFILETSNSFEEVLLLKGSKSKIEEFEKTNGITCKEYISNLAVHIGNLKWSDNTDNLGLKFKPKNQDGKQLEFSKIYCRKEFKYLGDDEMIKTVRNYSLNKSDKVELESKIKTALNKKQKKNSNRDHLINGHDFFSIFSIGLRKVLGSRNYNSVELEEIVVLAYDSNDFISTKLYKKIKNLETKKGLNFMKI